MIDKQPPPPAPDPSKKPKAPVPVLRPVLALFIQRIDALAQSLPLMVAVLQLTEQETGKRLNTYLDKYATPKESEPGKRKTFTIGPENYAGFHRLRKRLDTARHSRTELPRTYIIALVSQFDAFLGRLIRALFLIKPEMLSASEKSLPFKQLLELDSLDEAREYIIEKEVESVLRESHTEHFKWLEGKCGLPLRKDLPVWSTFIEVTERRNLFVHTGGVVSSQYLKVCGEAGVSFAPPHFEKEPKAGDELGVSQAYFATAYKAVFEVAFKLTHVLWRKLLPQERAQADSDLIDVTYDVIVEEDYDFACVLLSFATGTIKTFSSEDKRLRLVLNCAQAHKWAGRDAECKKILEDEDWSATSLEFQLAVAVLRDEFDTAASHMRSIGASGSPAKSDYRDWPIFREFRKSEQFLSAFAEVFGGAFEARIGVGDDADVDIFSIDPKQLGAPKSGPSAS